MDAPKLHIAFLKLALLITHGIVNALGSFYFKGIFFWTIVDTTSTILTIS